MPRKNVKTDVFKSIDMSGGPTECWPWTKSLGGRDKRPYFTVDGRKQLAYRVVYELVTGEPVGDDKVLRHSCDNNVCCNPAHLTPGTHQDNMDDMKERERHGLPHHTVRRIRKLLDKGVQTHAEIGELFGVTRSVITDIRNRNLYKHVKDEE